MKMSEKNRILWRVTAASAINLAMLILLVFSLKNAAALCLGCSGERVAVLQRSLASAGLYDGEISGIYDLTLRKSIKIFQQESGLEASGEADAETVTLLGISSKSGDCFCAETELLARVLEIKYPTANYTQMLAAAKKELEEIFSLAELLSGEMCEKILAVEPSSTAYEAACEALSQR